MIAPKISFQMLQERFVTGLERRVAQLDDCLNTFRQCAGGAVSESILDAMMRGFHSLAGIGGTYGFDEITDLARRGELLCRSIGGAATPEDVISLGVILEALEAARVVASGSHTRADHAVAA